MGDQTRQRNIHNVTSLTKQKKFNDYLAIQKRNNNVNRNDDDDNYKVQMITILYKSLMTMIGEQINLYERKRREQKTENRKTLTARIA